MSDISDSIDLGETQRTHKDDDFPLQNEGVPDLDDESSDPENAYNQLTLFEKLKDSRWQFRRKAYSELYTFFETEQIPANAGEDLKPETMVPWIQNMINEHNMIAFVEALKALNSFLTHHTCSRPQLASFTGPLMDKLVLNKKNIQNLILEILDKLIEGDEAYSIPQEILKRLDNKNHKFLNQLLLILLKYVKKGSDDSTIRVLFKAMVPLLTHSNKETRQLALEIVRVLYSYVEESFKEMKDFAFGNLRHAHLKELEILQKTPKAKGRRLIKLNDGSFKVHDAGLKKAQAAQKVDLMTLLPEKYLEVPYLVQTSGESFVQFNQNEKKRKLEEFNQRIEQILKNGSEIDTNKDYSTIINLLILMLEDKNILINAEAIKSVDYLVRILKSNFPQSKLKHILTLIIEKLDAKKKTTYNTSLIQVLDDSIAYNCIIPENLCELLLYHAESNKNMNVRTSCLNWFCTSLISFLTNKRDVLYSNMSRTYQIQDKLAASISTKLGKTQTGFSNLEPDERMERLITIIYRKIQQLHKKETNITLKKKCQQVIESLENLYSKAEVISPPREDQNPYERGGNLTDISSIKGNSKVINVSNLSLIAPADYTYEDYKENDIMKELLGQEKTTRTQITLPGNETKRGEFSFENLKTIEKEQFGKIMAMFNDIKPQDEHICDKLDAIGTFIEKANMEVIQACQNSVIKMLKKTLLNNATDPRNILRIFESGNNVLIKINKICLEILPETLKTELKMLMILANVLNNKSVEKTLDSIYMTCSLEKFLGNTLDLFEKVDTKYVGLISEAKLANSLRIYLNWLVLKVEKIQNVMFGEGTLKELEQGISQFRFSNLPQVHLGLVNVLNKKIGAIETSRDQGNQSIRSYETPRIARRNKPASLDPQSVMGLMEFGAHHHHSVEKDQQQIALRMKQIQDSVKSNVKSGLDKFGSLLSSLKKNKNLDRLNMSSFLSPTDASLSPNRHWKRGLGREGTPLGKSRDRSIDLGNTESIRKSKALSLLPGNDKPLTIEVEEVVKFLTNVCSYMTAKDTESFDQTLSRLKTIYPPKDFLHIMTSLTPKLLSKDCYGSRVPGEFIINLLQNYLETLDKSSFFRTLKAFFSIKSRENDQQTIKNVAHVALELTLNFYKHVKFPHKLVSSLVEIIVFSLTEKELRVLSEEVLELISNSIGREGLKRVFEIELINSGRLYQIFLFWLDQQQSFGNSPMQQKKETSPIPRKEDIYIEQNETHTLIDDSFSQSYTPQRPVTGTQKRQSPTADLRHSFDKALDEADHQDINQLSEILLTEEYLDEPNFGTNIRGLDTEGSKTGPERQEMRELSNIPSLSQFKQSIRSEFGMGDLVSDKKEFNKRENLHEKKPSRAILGERNLDDFQKSLERVEFNERNFKADKENVQDVNRMTGGWNNQGTEVKREKRDDSAEKWKEKFLQEKGRLQQTIELLEKANQGFFNQMSEKSDLVGKLNQQRQMNESLLEKFNGLSSENEKLKKEAQAFEMERERLSQHSMVLNSTLLNSRPDLKKIRNHKFVMEALPIAARSHGRNTEEFIKQFQEVLLTSDNLEYEIGENLMKIYEDFEEYDEKVQFVINLKTSISHPQVINNLSIQNHKFLLEIALKLCISENTQKEIVLANDGVTFIETDLTNEMQLLLDTLLRFHSANATITNLLRVLSDSMPVDFDIALSKSQKMMLKLAVKCLVKLSASFKSLITEDIKVFDVLIEIYKMFKLHPPESLKETQPNIKDFDMIYRNIRTLADHIIDLSPNKAKEFSEFFTRENNKSIFLDYVKSYIAKYYPNLSNSSNISF